MPFFFKNYRAGIEEKNKELRTLKKKKTILKTFEN